MTGCINEDGRAIPMPSVDFGNNTKAAAAFRDNWINEQKALGRKIIPE